MSWQGFLDQQGSYLEAHAHSPWNYPLSAPAVLTDTAKTVVTGTETDDKFTQQIIGHDIPIFVGGQALMGNRIYEGPFYYTEDDVNLVDMIVGCAVTATPSATRTIDYLSLNGTKSATSPDGGTTWAGIGPAFAGLEISVRTGTEDQLPFASSISRYGSKAVPYRSHICAEIKKIPLSVFNNQYPFVSLPVFESEYITRNNALAALARYSRYDDSEFEFSVSGRDQFWIVAQQSDFIGYLQQLRKILRNWNITTTDKLRVFENDSSAGVNAVLTRSNAFNFKFTRGDPLAIPRQRSYSFIDIERDNDFNAVTATRERFPVPLTSSQNTETIELPIGTTATLAKADVNRSLLIDDIARSRMACTVNSSLYGVQPGDIASFDDDPNISFLGRVVSAARNTADFTVDIACEKIDYFTFNIRPVITSGSGATASYTIDENTTSVATLTATDADGDTITWSIDDGADGAFFTINPSTGALSFIDPPDYETPIDADSDNDYIVIVQASDGALVDTQTITVTVANVVIESGSAPITTEGGEDLLAEDDDTLLTEG
jgi:hypothetical protein